MPFISFNELPLHTDDFFFIPPKNDTIVLFNPQDAVCISPVFLRSRKTLEEHIRYINEHNVKKAAIVADNIDFIRRCPSLEDISVYTAVSAENMDFSPLYDMPNIKRLYCDTMYGANAEKYSCVDYSKVKGLQCLITMGKKGHLNICKVRGLKTLHLQEGKACGEDLADAFDVSRLECLSLTQMPLRSLRGLEKAKKLRILELNYNRNLADISALGALGGSLQSLWIEACGKITDFSALAHLPKLEQLYLLGSNHLPNLDFLKNMPKLKALKIFMTVDDGNLALCDGIPWVMIKGKKHYNRKDRDFTKISFASDVASYREYD